VALYAFDGTWNTTKQGDDPKYTNTNVSRFYQAYRQHSNTQDFYVAGIGTRFDLLGKVLGGVFGLGELPRIDEAYDHLCTAWAAGDHVIDIIGFSRGAATTLDFCHRIQEKGIRRPGSNTVVEPNPRIRFLGVWDVVAAFGLANLGNTELNIGHHLSLPRSSLQYCFHAMALDERRPSFLPTRLHGACEVWFRGVHSDVGGGNGNRGLNDIALKWMMSKAKAAGLPITAGDIAALRPDPASPPHLDKELHLDVRLVSAVDRGHYTLSVSQGCTTLPGTCQIETAADEQIANELGAETLEVLTPEARRRVAALWDAAAAAAGQLEFPIDGVRDPLLTLFQGRVPLITNEDQLKKGRDATVQLVASMVRGAQRRGFHAMTEFFLNEALFALRPLYPFTE
jgi:Uncharacterized alpha/beta hydrolase domain (DUF2235)